MAEKESNSTGEKKQSRVVYDPKLALDIGLIKAILYERIRFLTVWKDQETFQKTNEDFARELGISKKQLLYAREALVEEGLIWKNRGSGTVTYGLISDKREVLEVTKGKLPKHKKGFPKVQKGTPTHIIKDIENIETKREGDSQKILEEFSTNLPSVSKAKNKRVGKKEKLLILKAEHQEEFDSFWQQYAKAWNEKIKPFNAKNGKGEKGSCFENWCLRREEGFSSKDLVSACRAFFVSQVNTGQKSSKEFCNTKLQSFLKQADNIRDLLEDNTEEQDYKLSVVDFAQKFHERWSAIEDNYLSQPSEKSRIELAERWTVYFNDILRIHGIQFAIEGWQSEVEPQHYIVPEPLVETWTTLARSRYPLQAEKWELDLKDFQDAALLARQEELIVETKKLEGTNG
mgnify:CR=1 FL=1